MAERFLENGGWIQVILTAGYASFLIFKMLNPAESSTWRRRSWTLFSFVFFTQLVLGIFSDPRFLMTGKLHLPIPALILCGPVYRGEISVMTILFVSTLILTGPAWCSHFCYFGAVDAQFAMKKGHRGKLKKKMQIKHTILAGVLVIVLLLRWLGVGNFYATMLAIIFGAGGLAIILFVSSGNGRMMHCILYCQIGTLVNYGKLLNPFRMKIDSACTFCENCSRVCRYDALTLADITKKRPGKTCTYCGDCLSACSIQSISYRFPGLSAQNSRNLYLFLTVSVHAIFMSLARI